MKTSLKFIIRKDRINTNGTCPIYLRYGYLRKVKDIPLGYNISPKFFYEDSGSLSSKFSDYKELDSKMKDLKNKVELLLESYFETHKEYPTVQEILLLLKNNEYGTKKKQSKTLDDYFTSFVEDRTSKHLRKSTLKVYSEFWTKWKGFESTQKTLFRIEDLNENTFNKFNIYLINLGLQKNTIGKFNKTLKTFLNFLIKILNVPISYKQLKVNIVNTDYVILDEYELELLSSFVLYSNDIKNETDIELTERQRLIGRIFLFLCSTGLSYVDYDRLTINNIFIEFDQKIKKEIVRIKISRQKIDTTLDCVIPILGRTIDLIFLMLGYEYYGKDYDKEKPFFESDDKVGMLKGSIKSIKDRFKDRKILRIFRKVPSACFNREIKDVLRIIGINERVKINKVVKNVKEEDFDFKYNHVSSHTGRRTYINWCIRKKVDRSVIMKSTGHTSYKTLERYTKVEEKTVYHEFMEKIEQTKKEISETLKINDENDDDDLTSGFHIKPS